MSGRWLLPPLWFDLCWEIGGFDEYPFPIAVPSHGETREERAVLRQRAQPEMQAGGVVRGEALTPEFAEVLARIATPGLWIEGLWMPDDVNPSPVRLLSVASGRDSILLVQGPGENESFGGDLRVTVYANTSVAEAAVQGMPPAPPGNKPRTAVPLSTLRDDAAADDDFGETSMMESHPSARRQDTASWVRAFAEAEHYRDGQFTANLRDRTGGHQRSPVLRWFDAFEPDGRYGLNRLQRAGYEPELVLAPLGPPELRAALDQQVARINS